MIMQGFTEQLLCVRHSSEGLRVLPHLIPTATIEEDMMLLPHLIVEAQTG